VLLDIAGYSSAITAKVKHICELTVQSPKLGRWYIEYWNPLIPDHGEGYLGRHQHYSFRGRKDHRKRFPLADRVKLLEFQNAILRGGNHSPVEWEDFSETDDETCSSGGEEKYLRLWDDCPLPQCEEDDQEEVDDRKIAELEEYCKRIFDQKVYQGPLEENGNFLMPDTIRVRRKDARYPLITGAGGECHIDQTWYRKWPSLGAKASSRKGGHPG
jgi:hypothetical protein